jgi:putative mycofactocin binding protein MftB
VSTEAPGGPAFDLDRPWRLDERAAVRPEPFGALLYHFGTRRLSFLKNATVLAVVRSLAERPSARSACAAAGVGDRELPAYARALAALAESKIMSERTVE